MKALLQKDYLVILRQMKYFLFAELLFILVQKPSIQLLSMLYTFILSLNLIQRDDQSGWLLQSAALPVSRRTLVLEKYLLCYLNLAAVTLLLLASIAVARLIGHGGNNTFVIIPTGLCMSFAFVALLLPALFFFGAEKGRYLMILIIGAAWGIIFSMDSAESYRWLAARADSFIALLPAIVCLLNFVSIPLSIKFYGRHLK